MGWKTDSRWAAVFVIRFGLAVSTSMRPLLCADPARQLFQSVDARVSHALFSVRSKSSGGDLWAAVFLLQEPLWMLSWCCALRAASILPATIAVLFL